jgi:hypothetical protein
VAAASSDRTEARVEPPAVAADDDVRQSGGVRMRKVEMRVGREDQSAVRGARGRDEVEVAVLLEDLRQSGQVGSQSARVFGAERMVLGDRQGDLFEVGVELLAHLGQRDRVRDQHHHGAAEAECGEDPELQVVADRVHRAITPRRDSRRHAR